MRSFKEHFIAEAKGQNTETMAFIRGNPPTVGHEQVYNKVAELNNQLGGTHRVILSRTHDGIKNPLPADVKLMHHQRSFPGMNIVSATAEQPSLLHHAADAYSRGIRNLNVVAGQDRVNEFNSLLNRYNGVEGPHGFFNFPKGVQVHSSGDRDPDAEGVEGVSGTSQRAHATLGNREAFHAGAPSALTPDERDHLMQDLQKYSVPAPVKGKKKLKEDFDSTVSGIHPPSFMPATVGDVRGLGNVTGDPAINSPDELEAYWDRNMDGADASNDKLGKLKQAFHDSIHINNSNVMDTGSDEWWAHKNTKVVDVWKKARPRGL
jgi:hypothetical protein